MCTSNQYLLPLLYRLMLAAIGTACLALMGTDGLPLAVLALAGTGAALAALLWARTAGWSLGAETMSPSWARLPLRMWHVMYLPAVAALLLLALSASLDIITVEGGQAWAQVLHPATSGKTT